MTVFLLLGIIPSMVELFLMNKPSDHHKQKASRKRPQKTQMMKKNFISEIKSIF